MRYGKSWIFCVCLSWSLFGLAEDAHEAPIPPLPPEQAIAKPESEAHDQTFTVINYDDSEEKPAVSRYFNALEISGYFRTRFSYFRNAHLGTYIPELHRGTSNFAPNMSLLDGSTESNDNPTQSNYSANIRLRLDPTVNISETMRVRTTLDIFDSMVLGTTPSYLSNPSVPVSMMSMSQNSLANTIAVKRAWGEASFPVGELRFGRMPMHWGLGIVYNSGDATTSDYGDQVDGISFTTRLFEHYFTPAYAIAYTGPVGRGGGFKSATNFPDYYGPNELGQRYPLESSDITHVVSLSFLKRDSDFISSKKRAEGKSIFNYGLFASYRRQDLDSQNDGITVNLNTVNRLVKRDANVGLSSLWSAWSYGTFHLELELAGIWGKYQIGEKASDLLAVNNGDAPLTKRDIWLLQGGLALESRYGFLNDRLQIGLDSGWASSQDGPGFGIREGAADGRKLPSNDGYKTNFKFNPAYTVDLLMYKEILSAVSGTFYLKPHIAYFFSRNFGVRGDIIGSVAPIKENTTGGSNFLGVELDASSFIRTESGFYSSLAYGVLFPLQGLNHQKTADIDTQKMALFGEAKVAQTINLYLGLVF